MREAELADLKKEVDEMATKAQSYAHFDPIDDIRKDIEKAASPPPDLDAPVTDTAASAPAAGTPPIATTSDVSPPASPPAATETPAAPSVTPAEPAAPQNTAPVNTPDAGRAA